MEKKKNRWSLALALGLLLSLATGCGDDEKDEWQTFPGKWEDAEHLKGWLLGILPEEANVIVTQTDCDTPGIFLRIEEMPTRENWKDSLVYCHNDWLTPYKDQATDPNALLCRFLSAITLLNARLHGSLRLAESGL